MANIKIPEYWELTLKEIKLYITAYNQNKNEEIKNKAILLYRLGDLIGSSVSRLLDKNAKYPEVYDAFPGLFEEEKQKIEEAKRKQELEKIKVNWIAFAENHNKKIIKK